MKVASWFFFEPSDASKPAFNDYNTSQGGDSGSPNMITMPDGSLVFVGGTTSSGPSTNMQAAINTLSESRGFTNVYQLTWHNYNP